MIPDIVVDVGNTRIKWRRCTGDRPEEQFSLVPDKFNPWQVSLPPGDPNSWNEQLQTWSIGGSLAWAVAGTHPVRRDEFVLWLKGRSDQVQVIDSWKQIPLRTQVDHPDRVGIDRLLNALAAQKHRRVSGAIIIDAGTAVTVDWMYRGAFQGGAILPGIRLMARSLHEHTALLPEVEIKSDFLSVPGMNTHSAIQGGIFYAVLGGVALLAEEMIKMAKASIPPNDLEGIDVFLTGGDGPLLISELSKKLLAIPDSRIRKISHMPEMTLEGIRIAAEALP